MQQHGVKQLIIGGLQSEFCVDTTTRRALALGFPLQLIADGQRTTVDKPVLSAAQIRRHHNETLANIGSFGPRARAVLAAEISI
ncbi:MAG: isochorismatase family protein [Rheinheimera sp.]|nr:isochorismatase family protein [Rheinheimera sp.]